MYSVKVRVTDGLGCIESCRASVTVEAPEHGIIIPNIFTPNGDGKNDVFTVLNYTEDQPLQMKIYTRWGKQVAVVEDGSA